MPCRYPAAYRCPALSKEAGASFNWQLGLDELDSLFTACLAAQLRKLLGFLELGAVEIQDLGGFDISALFTANHNVSIAPGGIPDRLRYTIR